LNSLRRSLFAGGNALPIIVTFDLSNPAPSDLNRIRGFFERLGWEHLGNTAYRYPKLYGQHPTEDWFNHIIPALMLLRAFAQFAPSTGCAVEKSSIDVQSSTGYNPVTDVGTLPLPSAQITFSQPSRSGRAFGKRQLDAWLDAIAWPYAGPPAGVVAAGT
jgi:hypothetical protein